MEKRVSKILTHVDAIVQEIDKLQDNLEQQSHDIQTHTDVSSSDSSSIEEHCSNSCQDNKISNTDTNLAQSDILCLTSAASTSEANTENFEIHEKDTNITCKEKLDYNGDIFSEIEPVRTSITRLKESDVSDTESTIIKYEVAEGPNESVLCQNSKAVVQSKVEVKDETNNRSEALVTTTKTTNVLSSALDTLINYGSHRQEIPALLNIDEPLQLPNINKDNHIMLKPTELKTSSMNNDVQGTNYGLRKNGNSEDNVDYGQQQQQQQPNVAAIGQRRPASTTNFVPGGQLTPQKGGIQQQQPQQQQQQQQPRSNQNTGAQYRNQQQQQMIFQMNNGQSPGKIITFLQPTPTKQQQAPINKPPPQQQQQSPAPKPQPPQPKQQSPLLKPQPPAVKKEQSVPPQPMEQQQQQPPPTGMESIAEQPNLENGNDESMETGDGKKKPFWARTGNKISKREKVRRRNVRLSKMLQPKNAVMILNELVKNTTFTVDEMSLKIDGNQYKATVIVEDVEHVGYGRSKIHAKNAAAEVALKHYIKDNKLREVKNEDDEGDEKMEITEDEASKPLPWQHVASFALFKLFTSWGEDPNLTQSQIGMNTGGGTERQHENRPAKKMPDNPETVNPLMLVNQMLPQAQFEEIGKSGNPPNVTFSYKCIVDDNSFVGTGPNKKAAKKMAAFGACHKVLGINYPLDVYVPIY